MRNGAVYYRSVCIEIWCGKFMLSNLQPITEMWNEEKSKANKWKCHNVADITTTTAAAQINDLCRFILIKSWLFVLLLCLSLSLSLRVVGYQTQQYGRHWNASLELLNKTKCNQPTQNHFAIFVHKIVLRKIYHLSIRFSAMRFDLYSFWSLFYIYVVGCWSRESRWLTLSARGSFQTFGFRLFCLLISFILFGDFFSQFFHVNLFVLFT